MALTQLTKVDGGGISTTSDYRVGIITASKFVGPFDGTGGNFSGVVTATNGVFSGNISAVDGNFSGNVTIGGTLTYEDVTNIDSVGIITAQKDIHVGAGLSVVGVTTIRGNLNFPHANQSDANDGRIGSGTFGEGLNIVGTQTVSGNGRKIRTFGSIIPGQGGADLGTSALDTTRFQFGYFNGLKVRDNVGNGLHVGDSADLKLYHTGNSSTIKHDNGSGDLLIDALSTGSDIRLRSEAEFQVQVGGNTHIQVYKNGGVSFNQAGTGAGKKLETISSGARVTGTLDVTDGITVAGNIDANGDLDVDGHTNLDNVSIAGITTHNEDVRFITANGGNILIDKSDNSIRLGDSVPMFFGLNKMWLQHNGSTGYLNNVTGSLYIRNESAGDIYIQGKSGEHSIICNDNGAVELYYDNVKTAFTGQDALYVYGRTGNSGMVEIASGQGANNNDRFRIHKTSAASRLTIQNYSTGSWVENIRITAGGAVELKHADGTTKFETTSTGATVTGHLTVTDDIFLSDANVAYFGTNNDMRIYHSGTHGYVKNTVGNLYFMTTNSEYGALLYANGGAELRYDNVKKFETTTDGISVTGDILLPNAGSNLKIWTGGTQGIIMAHTGTYGEIDNLTGMMRIKAGTVNLANRFGNYNFINCAASGSVDLYYDAQNHTTPKLKTSTTGITVDGEVAASQDYPNIRPVLDFNFAATKKLKPEMTFTREGQASFHDGVGSVKFASTNEPRFEHDIITGECKGLMFERAGTNYSWYSRFFKSSGYSAGSWVPQNGGATPTITENTHTAPDGTSHGYYMADTISGATGTAFNGNVVQQQHTAGANVKHTFSIYIKLLTATQATIYVRDGATGSISSTNAVNVKNWQRVIVTTTNALTNGVTHGFYIGNTNGDIAVWGSQIERSDYASSYIKTTTGANGTRNADQGVQLDGEEFTDVFNEGKGTLIAEVIPTFSLSNQVIVGLHQDFGSNNRVEVRTMGNTTANARFESVVSGSSVVSNNTLAHAGINNVSKYGFAVEKDNYAMCVNGGTVATDTSGAFPPGINSMMIGDASYGVESGMIIKRIMYYSDRLPNSQLVTLTS